MNISDQMTQNPMPGSKVLRFKGDVQQFRLTLTSHRAGRAWLRTNLEQAETIRDEIIREVTEDLPRLEKSWFDIPMERSADGSFTVSVPLCEVGHFEAKCFFMPRDDDQPEWPAGPNTAVNIEPADTCCANIVYNAFVRQFGPNKSNRQDDPNLNEAIDRLDKAGYTVIPPSGTFRSLIKELDFIIGTLGCRYLLLLPIHPTPTTYARMGRFGSPYAALSFTEVDPALAEFDPQATPLEQFIELVDAVHQRRAKIIIDIAINHTGWAAGLHESHPEWLVRDETGRIEAPGAWGIVWADLTKLDYSFKDLWQYMADIFLTWCRRGVDGFRCDAGYMIPIAAWEYIVATVRNQYPDAVFLLEGLGGKISVTRALLNRANLNWAYSELFQNYSRRQIETYLPGAIEISQEDGVTVHFAETHDNNRLASTSDTYAFMRTALCALCSGYGAFGFANGVEWLAKEKIIVHEASSLNWGAEPNLVEHIQRLNLLLKTHPAFFDQTDITFPPNAMDNSTENSIVLLRTHRPTGKQLLIAVNLDENHSCRACWPKTALNQNNANEGHHFFNLLHEKANDLPCEPVFKEDRYTLILGPGQVVCLTNDPADKHLLNIGPKTFPFQEPVRISQQRYRAKILEVLTFFHNSNNPLSSNPGPLIAALKTDPEDFCRTHNPHSSEARVITWNWPSDAKREVMVPPHCFLLVKADHHFRAQIMDDRICLKSEESLYCDQNYHFALFRPGKPPKRHCRYHLKISLYDTPCIHAKTPLLYLAEHSAIQIQKTFHHSELLKSPIKILCTNSRGGMLRADTRWGYLESRYDALLAANINPDFPEDRRILLSRLRAWIVFQGHSHEISDDCLDSFGLDEKQNGLWRYHIPTGQGQHIVLFIHMAMHADNNKIQITFFRSNATVPTQQLPDDQHVRLILRPDIEDRNFHETTKAYQGAENNFPDAVRPEEKGFIFEPNPPVRLHAEITQGIFAQEPEWQYMVHRPYEAERGLDPDSDLFSPGYFATDLKGGQMTVLAAGAISDNTRLDIDQSMLPHTDRFEKSLNGEAFTPVGMCLKKAIDHFIVKRGRLNTVIAGYPWFLDWGRDTLIFVQSLIEIGRTEEARAILLQFAELEENGTIPNMIHGANASNRDTSDAPLWFFLGCCRTVKKEKQNDFLKQKVKNRTIRTVLISMANAIINGTPNGIVMDADSGLIFSPSHYTWMDTNFPAGTPREGYPIEIQALWYAAISFLADVESSKENRNSWKDLARTIQNSIITYYLRPADGFLSDCLHAKSGVPAAQAKADDALRPNQLLAITLGAIDDTDIAKRILSACQTLLVPGAIRSLADRRVEYPIPVIKDGQPLNDPHLPYKGTYQGDEDTCRKPAYHNGTSWTWMFPSFPEAWAMTYGKNAIDTALAWLSSSSLLLTSGCLGQIPEILDGDWPHTHRGCDAQAWGSSELLRVRHKLMSNRNNFINR